MVKGFQTQRSAITKSLSQIVLLYVGISEAVETVLFR